MVEFEEQCRSQARTDFLFSTAQAPGIRVAGFSAHTVTALVIAAGRLATSTSNPQAFVAYPLAFIATSEDRMVAVFVAVITSKSQPCWPRGAA